MVELTIDHIKSKLESCPQEYNYSCGDKPAAVLIPLLFSNGLWKVLFTRRTEDVRNHKGQVSFPGGAIDPMDASPIRTALRETWEEINLDPLSVIILGCLPGMSTTSHYYVKPVVGFLKETRNIHANTNEVNRIFTVPLDWLAEESNSAECDWQSEDGIIKNVIFYKSYNGEKIWGITARIIKNLIYKLEI